MKTSIYKSLVFWVIIGLILGVIVGACNPIKIGAIDNLAIWSKVFIDIFIKALKLLIGPIIFVMIILGILGLGDIKKVGSIGLKAVIYFEVVSTLALAIGIFMARVLQPGAGLNLDPTSLDAKSVEKYVSAASSDSASFLGVLKSAIPSDILSPFTEGKTLQVLFIALITAFIVVTLKEDDRNYIKRALEVLQAFVFKILTIVMYFSPLATFGAMAFLVQKYGISSLQNMVYLLVVMLISCLVFIFGILGLICFFAKINIFKFMRFIAKELLIVFTTSSSESALLPLMKKLEKAGVDKACVGLVLPTGYSFNLDCTNIYLALCVIFLAQAFNIDLSLWQEITILLILMVTSKGAVGVTGSGFIVLAGTLSSLGNDLIPVATVSILLGVDKFMSEMRACGNLCGNSVACVIVAVWNKQIDMDKFRYALDHPNEYRIQD
ncbi:cation:dicarboxylate symporter family transporter [Campylobacter canadensis]|uniref:Cation:dicarboxylase symporter family transporter n=1 Tax=Campylobacter canadensis TaxID=449520 RepID=A0ABS7WTM8_9BACT|nr:cation:dicarboxylase symporter family transporter [Campylobacter canadensis]MBZ7988125.1 cation:dicarboxylase symporter family transporter [Campylobacter canadensis]MBZ7995583.1 cation:dicarboxylase symporter family transporter [Campylobacter canadensis]MBZ7997252.1 cation:dicarboxylase symporter family transporter [Campylobacter canadensis]MBZ7999107.1 cation:dicarboxylase symporter family transporter [Campylobacter canadensis]MBZ8000906.1 cation:dicarboxylase symporter family transporter 